MKKWVLTLIGIGLIVVFFIIAFATAQEQQTLGTFKQDSCVTLKQNCANCTFVNISRVSDPDSDIILEGNLSMTRSVFVYNYTFCDTNNVGQYIVDYVADPNGILTIGNFDFWISLTGDDPSEAESTIFLFIGVLSLIVFGLSLFGAVKIPWKHPRNTQGQILGINDLRYIKLFLWFFTYLVAIFIAFTFRHVSLLANLEVAGNWFNFMFWFLIVFLLPTFVMVFVMGIISVFDAKKIDKMMLRGFKVK